MKRFVFSTFVLMAVLTSSCSQFPEDKKIEELILAHEMPDFIKYHGSVGGVPCVGFKALEIPKEYTKISTLTGRYPHASSFERDMANANSILDKMTLNGLITMVKISERLTRIL